ncbi:sensor histidine kinase [Oxalobacteraceae bacterium OM1]|nr:sensor histidine kinase [Oxalobacteraceae bacterium OM1]
MRLSEFILNNMEPILQAWEDFARKIQPPHRSMDVEELRDHAKEILEEIAMELATPDGVRALDLHGNTPAEIHADTRAVSGFSVDQLLAEYRALRASVLGLWSRREKTATWFELEDMTRFNEALDRALAESVSRYSEGQSQAQDIFLGIIGHDLRTPLSAISLGATYLMRSDTSDSKLIQLGSRMYGSAERMQEIIDKLLDFVRSRSGIGIPVHRSDVDLALVSEQIVEEFRVSNPGVVIRVEMDGDLRGHWDGSRIAQVYQNLIGNAIQYGEHTPVSVHTLGRDGEIVLSVHNDGPPIPSDMQAHLFDPLRRGVGGPDHAANRKNMGLGLYIVREIVNAHDGTIDVTSTEETGTTFTVRLPRHAG